MTQVMNASEVRQQWSQLLNKVFSNQTRVIVKRSGIPVAAVISAEELERFIKLDEQREERFEALEKIRQAFTAISSEELTTEVGKALSEVRSAKQ